MLRTCCGLVNITHLIHETLDAITKHVGNPGGDAFPANAVHRRAVVTRELADQPVYRSTGFRVGDSRKLLGQASDELLRFR